MARILVFDSGVGGLSILNALQNRLHAQDTHTEWLFCSDNAFFPYGIKPEQELVARVCSVITSLDQHFQPDVIVIACNTASTVALQSAREHISTPIVGVVPAIKPAAALSESRVLGLLATPGTIQRAYTQDLIRDFAADCTVIHVGSSELVWMTEDFLRTGMVDHVRLHGILAPLRDAYSRQGLDTVVLACTHFPLLLENLQEHLPEVKHWVDSGEAIARRVAWCLEQPRQPIAGRGAVGNLAIFTREDPSLDSLKPALAHFGLHDVTFLPVPATNTVDTTSNEH